MNMTNFINLHPLQPLTFTVLPVERVVNVILLYLWLAFCFSLVSLCLGFPGGSEGEEESACNAGGSGSIPGPGRSPGEGKAYPLQYSCLENPMDRGACPVDPHGYTVHGVAKRQDRATKHMIVCWTLFGVPEGRSFMDRGAGGKK